MKLLLNDQVAFERLYTPIKDKILRFVWLNSCCQIKMIQDSLREVGVMIGEPLTVSYLYRLSTERWGANTDSYSATLKIGWKQLDSVL